MFHEFSYRGYPDILLNKQLHKLSSIDRLKLLTPRNNLIISHLGLHNRDIMLKYNIHNSQDVNVHNNNDCTFIALPYYGIHRYKTIVLKYLYHCLCNFIGDAGKALKIRIGFYIPNTLERCTRN